MAGETLEGWREKQAGKEEGIEKIFDLKKVVRFIKNPLFLFFSLSLLFLTV